jgi:hypothetical protein
MAHGGKVNTNPSRVSQHYIPDTGVEGPYTRTDWQLVDLVLVWLSGCAVGVTLALIVTGN